MEAKMRISNVYKLLLLLNILHNKKATKKQIISEFKKENINLNKVSITHYIKQLEENNIEINVEFNKKEKVYSIKQKNPTVNFSDKELKAIEDVKKLMIAQKNYIRIRKMMRLFYRIAKYIKDKEQQLTFINFGYYSTINWGLVLQLEKHCREKNIIMIDYILPNGTNRYINIHTDSVRIGEWSNRIYLWGVFEGGEEFSQLPVDRIFMVKKVIRKSVCFNMYVNCVKYTISKDLFKEIELDSKEKVLKTDSKYVTLQRPADDIFYLVQRLLYFCPDLYYVSEGKVKDLLKEKLETLKANYDNTPDE